ncbi:M91 family zinc metallopeptidase [Actinacidiphila rubida]|uniref:M91 family zinc metallopeptidase n=1 Tax=Actinacidiphila rubida TaxID=310780 RepID=UPI0008498B6C|nr:M91 family zinc metallopeptidase [Actinacidiphila rubida]
MPERDALTVSEPAASGPSDLYGEVHRGLPQDGFTFSRTQVHRTYEDLLEQRPAVAAMPIEAKAAHVADALTASAAQVVEAATGPLQQLTGRYFYGPEIHRVHQQLLGQRGDAFLLLPPEKRAEHVVAEVVDSAKLLSDVRERLHQSEVGPGHVSYVRDQLVRTHGEAFALWRPEVRADAAAEAVRQQTTLTRGVNAWLRERPYVRLWGADYRQVDRAYQDLVAEHGRPFTALGTGRQAAAVGVRIIQAQPSLMEAEGTRALVAGVDVPRMIAEAGAEDVRSPAAAEAGTEQDVRPGLDQVRRRLESARTEFRFTDAQIGHAYEELLVRRPAAAGLPADAKAAQVAESLVLSARRLVRAASGPLLRHSGLYPDEREVYQVHQELLQRRGDRFLRLSPEERAEHVVAEMVDRQELSRAVKDLLRQPSLPAAHVAYAHEQIVRAYGPGVTRLSVGERAEFVAQIVRQQRELTRGVDEWLRQRPGVRLWGADHREVDQAYQDLVAEHGRAFAALDTGRQVAAVGARILRNAPLASLPETTGARGAGVDAHAAPGVEVGAPADADAALSAGAGADVRRTIADAGAQDVRSPAAAEAAAQGLRPRSGPVRPWQLSPEERNGNAVAELVDRRQLLHGVREHLGDDRVTAAHVSYAYALILHIHGPEFTRLDIGHRAEFVAQVVRAHLTFTGDAHPAAEAQVREDPPAAVTAFEQDRPRPATDGLDQREAAESAKQKAVTVPPEPARRPVDTPSGFAGITVRWDREADPHFLSTVQEQLRLLASKPAGKALLDQIAAAAATSKLAAWQDVKVKIERIGGGTAIGQDAGFHAHAGNVTKAINSEWATRTGKGTLSLVRYNPNAWETPDGLRPPFIGLVHELIHVHRNLRGTSHPSAAVDEAQVVGFGEYADLEFTENKIREEHGLPPRRTYAGTVGPDLDDAHLPRTTGRTGPRRAGRGTTRGTGGYGTAGLLRNAGAGERELELSEKHGVRIGPSKRLSGGGHFSHSELDRIDAALGGLPAEHLRGNPDLQYIEPAAGSGDGASAYDRETRGIGMVRPAAVPSWLYTGLDRGSRAQRFVMDRLALSGYDGVPVADVLGFAGGRRNVMGGVSNVLANGNLLEWTVRHEVGHSVAEHRAWFWALRQQTAFGGWRVHTPVDGRVDEVADDVLRMADLEDKADVPDDEGRTLADVLARELVPSRLRDEPERLAGLARSFPGADEALRAGLERVVTFARVALAQPWTLDDGGAATQTIGLRVYHIDQEGSWVSYLRRERERHAVSNYQFSTPDEWFAEAYAAYFDPLPGPRERLHPVVREWFEEGLPQLLADERAPGTAGAVPMTPLSPAPPSAAPASAGAAAEPLAWAAMNIGGRLYTSPEGVSIRVRGPRRSGKDGRTPNQLADAAWQKLPEGTRQGLRKERLDLSVDPLTLAETDPALHQGLSNAGRSLEGGSIGSTAARNAVLEALGKRDPATRGAYWKGQDERDTVLGMVAREEQRVFRGRLPTRHTREQEAARAIDGASPVEALRRLLGGHEGVVIGEEHEGTAVQGLLAGHLADLKAAGVRTVYLGGVRGDSYQRHLDAYLASGTMPPELQSLTRHFDGAAASPHSAASAHSAGQGMRDLLRAARQHGVRIVGVDGRPARATGDATDAGAGFRRGAALNTYAAGLVRRDQRAAADGGGYLVVVGAGHTGAFPGPERQIELHGQKFRPGTEFPGIDDLLDVPRVVVDRDGALHPGPRSGRSGTDTDQARPDTAAVAGARPGAHADVDGTGLMAQVLDAHGDPRHDLLDAAAAAVEREERYGWVSRVNPYRDQGGEFRTNCVLAAIAVDTSLAEHAVFQAPGSDLGEPGRGLDGDGSGLRNYLGRYRDLEPYPVDGPATVVEAMTRAEPGQRGMVVVEGPSTGYGSRSR